jgi:hypothetical protein
MSLAIAKKFRQWRARSPDLHSNPFYTKFRQWRARRNPELYNNVFYNDKDARQRMKAFVWEMHRFEKDCKKMERIPESTAEGADERNTLIDKAVELKAKYEQIDLRTEQKEEYAGINSHRNDLNEYTQYLINRATSKMGWRWPIEVALGTAAGILIKSLGFFAGMMIANGIAAVEFVVRMSIINRMVDRVENGWKHTTEIAQKQKVALLQTVQIATVKRKGGAGIAAPGLDAAS